MRSWPPLSALLYNPSTHASPGTRPSYAVTSLTYRLCFLAQTARVFRGCPRSVSMRNLDRGWRACLLAALCFTALVRSSPVGPSGTTIDSSESNVEASADIQPDRQPLPASDPEFLVSARHGELGSNLQTTQQRLPPPKNVKPPLSRQRPSRPDVDVRPPILFPPNGNGVNGNYIRKNNAVQPVQPRCTPGHYVGSVRPVRATSLDQGQSPASRDQDRPSSPVLTPPSSKGRRRLRSREAAVARRQLQQTPTRALTCPAYLLTPPSIKSWKAVRTDEWLQDYWRRRRKDFSTRPGGFISLFRQEFLNDPTSTCQLGADDCRVDPCVQANLASISPCDLQPAYHVLVAQKNLKKYISDFVEALRQAVLGAALTRDSIGMKFYPDPDHQNYDQFKTMATIVNAIVGLAGPTAPVLKTVIPTFRIFPDAIFFLPPHVFANFQVLQLSSVGPR